MFITTHALIGALVAEQIPNAPLWAFGLSFIAHFLADIIPHGDSTLYKGYVSGSKMRRAIAYVTLDAVVAIVGILFLFNTTFAEHRLAISLGIFGGILPDLLVALSELIGIKQLRWFHRGHLFFHNLIVSRRGDIPLGLGIVGQIVILLLLVSRV